MHSTHSVVSTPTPVLTSFPNEESSREVWQVEDLFSRIISFLPLMSFLPQVPISISEFLTVCTQWHKQGIAYMMTQQSVRISCLLRVISNSQVFSPEKQKKLQSFAQTNSLVGCANLSQISEKINQVTAHICKALENPGSLFGSRFDFMRDFCRDLAEIGEIRLANKIVEIISDSHVKLRARKKIAYFCEENKPLNSENKEEEVQVSRTSLRLTLGDFDVIRAIGDSEDEEAINICEEIPDPYAQSFNFNQIIFKMLRDNRFAEAIEIANKISDKDEQSLAFFEISTVMILDARCHDQAIDIAVNKIVEKDVQLAAIHWLSKDFTRLKNFDKAFAITHHPNNPKRGKILAIRTISAELKNMGCSQLAQNTLKLLDHFGIQE